MYHNKNYFGVINGCGYNNDNLKIVKNLNLPENAGYCPFSQIWSHVCHLKIDLTMYCIFSTLSRWVCVPGTLLIFMCSIINLQGVGTVVSGTCMQGVIHVNDVLLMGPTSLGEFIPVSIRGVHRKRLPVREVRGGQTASFALKKVKYFMGKSVLTSIQATHCRQSDFPPPTWLSLLPRGFPYSHTAWE